MKKNSIYIITAIVVVVVGVGAYFGGYYYGKQQGASSIPNFAAMRASRGGQGTARGGNGGGMVRGQILSKDSGTMTLKINTGGSKIVLFSSSTPVRKTVEDNLDSVQVGQSVMVGGTTNSDGSITAQSIQLITDTTTPGGF